LPLGKRVATNSTKVTASKTGVRRSSRSCPLKYNPTTASTGSNASGLNPQA